MQILPYFVAYLAIGVFLIATIVRFRMWSKMPIHVRWELYPVAHEGKRAHYGGSYLEESDWWKKPREVSLWGELRHMIPEILFLVACKEHNPKLWLRSFPFHFGLYLTGGCTAVMIASGILGAVAPSVVEGGFGTALYYATLSLGLGGLILGLLGALGLLHRRLTDPDLADFTTGADLFNLIFFIVAFGFALLTIGLVDNDMSKIAAFVANLSTFNVVALEGSGAELFMPLISIVLLSVLIVYIPLTHMSHFVGKYFAYHAIRWNDTPNLAGGPQEKEIHAVLSQKVSWAASHIDAQGKKTWVDLATEEFKK